MCIGIQHNYHQKTIEPAETIVHTALTCPIKSRTQFLAFGRTWKRKKSRTRGTQFTIDANFQIKKLMQNIVITHKKLNDTEPTTMNHQKQRFKLTKVLRASSNNIYAENFKLHKKKCHRTHLPVADCPDLMMKASSSVPTRELTAMGTTKSSSLALNWDPLFKARTKISNEGSCACKNLALFLRHKKIFYCLYFSQ